MTSRIKLVRNDTRPQLIVSLTDSVTGDPLNVSGDAIVRLKFREEGLTTLKATLIGTKLAGRLTDAGTVDNTAPYDVPGVGGRVAFNWTTDALSGPAGMYEAEVEITFADGSIQTMYDLLKFRMREDF